MWRRLSVFAGFYESVAEGGDGGAYSSLQQSEEGSQVFKSRHKYLSRLKELNQKHVEEHGALETLVDSKAFQAFMGVLIGANAAVMGFETDLPDPPLWDMLEHVFLLAFMSELCAKCYVQGWQYWSKTNSDILWNIFDSIIVALGLFDFIIESCLDGSQDGMSTLFRIIRLLRIMRLFRLVKFLKQLYLLAFGFIDAVQAIFWVSILMSVGLYVCSIICARTVGNLPASDPHAEFLHEKFADVVTGMLTLFVLMSSPNLPDYLSQEGLARERPVLLLFLVVFVVIGSFGMIALLTGVISEGVFEKNQHRVDEARKELDEFMFSLEAKAEEIHGSLQVDSWGGATKQEVAEKAMPVIATLFEEAMVEYTDHQLKQLVDVMDLDHNGKIECHEFKHAVMAFAMGVKPLSIQEVHHAVNICIARLNRLDAAVDMILQHVTPGSVCYDLQNVGNSSACHDDDTTFRDMSNSHNGVNSMVSTNGVKEARAPWRQLFAPGQPAEDIVSREPPGSTVKSLENLERCLEECTDRQVAAQRDLEASLQQAFSDLYSRLQEKLAFTVADWRRVPLPGGHEVGDHVTSRISFNFKSGQVSKGDVGVVRGPCTGGDPGRVNVDFPSLRSANMLPAQISAATAAAAASAVNGRAFPAKVGGGSTPGSTTPRRARDVSGLGPER